MSMKKFMYFGIAALALTMAACSSDDEVAQKPEDFGTAYSSFYDQIWSEGKPDNDEDEDED